MKLIFSVWFAAFFIQASAQEFSVSAGKKSLVVFADDDNTNKALEIKSETIGDSLLTIFVNNDEIGEDWKRNFSICDSSGNILQDFLQAQDGSYYIKMSGLKTVWNPDSKYFIYTIALPKDPQKAMLVKVARILVCKIKIR